jgi:hypothetical protein
VLRREADEVAAVSDDEIAGTMRTLALSSGNVDASTFAGLITGS